MVFGVQRLLNVNRYLRPHVLSLGVSAHQSMLIVSYHRAQIYLLMLMLREHIDTRCNLLVMLYIYILAVTRVRI